MKLMRLIRKVTAIRSGLPEELERKLGKVTARHFPQAAGPFDVDGTEYAFMQAAGGVVEYVADEKIDGLLIPRRRTALLPLSDDCATLEEADKQSKAFIKKLRKGDADAWRRVIQTPNGEIVNTAGV